MKKPFLLSILTAAALTCSLFATYAEAATVAISWSAPQSNVDGSPLTDLAGHRAYCGTVSGQYDVTVDVGTETEYEFSGLEPGLTYYFAVSAYDESGQESQFSQELELFIPELVAELAISPSALSQTVIQGQNAESRLIEIWNAGAESLTYAVTDDVPWLTVTPDEGTVGTLYDTAEVVYNTASLSPGEYTGQITVTAPDASASPQTIGVSLLVQWAEDPGPSDGEELDVRRAEFGWQPVAGATWYQVYLRRDGKAYHNEWVEQTSVAWTPDFDMTGGAYEWWVRAWGPGIGTQAWSPGSEFSVNVCVPGQTTLTPATEEGMEGTCSYRWAQDDCTTWYQLYIARGGGTWHVEWYASVEGADFELALADHPLGNYQWWVRGWSPDGYGPWSDSSTYIRGQADLDDVDGSVPVGPVDLAWDSASCANAEWFYVWVNRNGRAYRQQWVNADDAPVVNGNRVVTLPENLPFGEYEWWVMTWASDGSGPWSAPASFEVATPTPLGLESSEDGQGTYFWWDEGTAHGATWYQVQLEVDGQSYWEGWLDMAEAEVEGSIRGATAPVLLPLGEVVWRLRAWNEGGLGAWSDDLSVIVR